MQRFDLEFLESLMRKDKGEFVIRVLTLEDSPSREELLNLEQKHPELIREILKIKNWN